ncbi:MAG: GatB/YqeY domain-containing protein [Clostridia bacterium]|nr:GatB/YqeY domain-containing protein [Clostridia bacterium]NCC75527.1 GatB/YqeY domain-containing protein [Clostridia bacterium]
MNIKEKLLEDLKEAMKAKDTLRKDLLQIVRAAVLQIEKDQQVTLEESGVFEILAKEYKKRSETVQELAGSDRTDIIEKNQAEMALIEAYLPAQLSEAQIEELVRAAIAKANAHSARDMGAVMKVLMPDVKGKADGKLVNTIVKRLLG